MGDPITATILGSSLVGSTAVAARQESKSRKDARQAAQRQDEMERARKKSAAVSAYDSAALRGASRSSNVLAKQTSRRSSEVLSSTLG